MRRHGRRNGPRICYIRETYEGGKALKPALTLEDANARLATNGADMEALLAKGDHMAQANDVRAAAAFYGAVLKVAQSRPAHIPAEHAMVARAQRQSAWCSDQFQNHLLSSLAAQGFGEGQRPARFQRSLDMMLGRSPRPLVSEDYPQMPAAHFYPDMP